MMINTNLLTSGIQLFIAVPLVGFIISLFVRERNENLLSRIAFLTTGIVFLLTIIFISLWMYLSNPVLNLQEFEVYKTQHFKFLIDFFFDGTTAVFLFVGSFLTFLIMLYSRYYLHREKGYKRFFNTVLFFFLGYNITIFAGNFETLFIGWELLGISSFLLIAFYRERYLPVRNAVKVFSIYRIGDVGILMAMWASHHLWHENITFVKLGNYELVHDHLQGHSLAGVFISVMILIAAAAKSAQFPFSSWLPRAMEGPTPSSAIFYGSLSVHFGVFLLLRTYPFWEEQTVVRVMIGTLGFVTAFIATFVGRVQSSIKTQIAYASIAQIGIIFIEIALGWKQLALFHFAGNAFLRTYQLLVSPSVVSYLIQDQFYHFRPRAKPFEDSLPKRFEYTLYQLSLKEFNLDKLPNKLIFTPLKRIGQQLNFLTYRNVSFYVIPSYFIALFFYFHQASLHPLVLEYLPILFSFLGFLFVLKAFSERTSPRLAWLLIIINHFWIALAISFNDQFEWGQVALYLSGVVGAGLLGFIIITLLRRREPAFFSLNGYYGHAYEYPRLAFLFLLACLGLMGFPISPTFIGEDLIFGHIRNDQVLLALFNALGFVMGGIALIRIYARLFLGPHCKAYHETALRSS